MLLWEVEWLDHLIAVLPADHPLTKQETLLVGALRDEPFVLWPRWRSPAL